MTKKQEQAILLLIGGGGLSNQEISENIGVNPSTLWRWLKNPEFQARYRELRRLAVESAVANLQGLCGDAVATLQKLLNSSNHPTACRAAIAILRQSQEGVDLFDLAERVERVEGRMKVKK